MIPCDRPRAPLPEPLRGKQSDSFTYDSIVVRLPDIGRRLLAENEFPAAVTAEIETLIRDIPAGRIRRLTDDEAPDAADWATYVEPYLGQDWLEAPWFVVETYFYRRVLEATRYFQSGSGRGVDPFAYQKRLALETMAGPVLELSRETRELSATAGHSPEHAADAGAVDAGAMDALGRLLALVLWGNQADLSMWAADDEEKPSHEDVDQQSAHTLADDTAAVLDHLYGRESPAKRADFVLDNAGFELIADLYLAGFLLDQRLVETVVLHVKLHPTFVSDAIEHDVRATIAYLAAAGHRDTAFLGERLKAQLRSGRLKLQTHPFWTSPLAMWEMPAPLKDELSQSTLLVSKGDANYRRLLGDRHWAFTVPFADIVCYSPAPLVALRTLKSQVAAGLRSGQPEKISELDPDWLINGRWGVIQFFNSSV
jgi:uncharacterized protein with ATP-grasp and redox domains